MTPEANILIQRIEQLISNPNVRHNPYYKSREEWITAQVNKVKEIKKTEKCK